MAALAVSGCDQDRAGARLLAVGTSIAGFTSSSGPESSSVSEHGPAARRGPPPGAGPANRVSVADSAANTIGGSRSPFLPERDSRDLIMVTSPDLITEALYAGWWTDISGAAVGEARTSNRDRSVWWPTSGPVRGAACRRNVCRRIERCVSERPTLQDGRIDAWGHPVASKIATGSR